MPVVSQLVRRGAGLFPQRCSSCLGRCPLNEEVSQERVPFICPFFVPCPFYAQVFYQLPALESFPDWLAHFLSSSPVAQILSVGDCDIADEVWARRLTLHPITDICAVSNMGSLWTADKVHWSGGQPEPEVPV